MGLQDAGMIWSDSPQRPMHVGGYMICTPPPRAGANYVRNLIAFFRRHKITAPPWNYRIAEHFLPWPAWQEVRRSHTRDHVLHHQLPTPGGEAELIETVSRLHSQRLDMSRPLWELHVIEGLAGNRFAIYQKVHHALLDGIAGMRTLVQASSNDPTAEVRPVWASTPSRVPPGARGPCEFTSSLIGALRNISDLIPSLCEAVARIMDAAMRHDAELVAPYSGPASPYNSAITSSRLVVRHAIDLPRIKHLARTAGVTVNDVLLATCGGAFRRHLTQQGALPAVSLTAAVPFAIARADASALGNKVGVMCASLGSHIAGAAPRLNAVARSTAAAKIHLQSMPEEVRTVYILLTMLPALLTSILPSVGRPIANVTVSNLPGPERRLYLNGASIDALYPTSTLTAGVAMNVTGISYCDQLHLGLVACPAGVTLVERLPGHLDTAFNELEQAFTKRRVPRRSKRPL
jgi:diacylglycerol O-acyltransferase / wax synthase